MRIAINTLPIQPYMTGIGHFARELLMASSHVTGHSFSRIAQSGENPAIESWNGEVWGVDSPSSVWEQLHLPGLLNERRSDLYVSPLFTCPLIRDVPSVVTIHDCIPKARPDLCTPAFLDYHEQFCAPCARAAEVILTVSHHSKQEICSYYDVPEEKITVAYQSISERFQPGAAADASMFNLPDNFVLYAGTIEPRKNLKVLIEAFGACCRDRSDWHLVLAGRRDCESYSLDGLIDASACRKRIHQVGYVPSEEMPRLFARASAFAFPSLYEGFGRPVIEAMASGTPVICSDCTSLPEIAGAAARLVPPEDVDAWSEALESIISSPDLRQEMRSQGLVHAKRFTLPEFASQLQRIYDRVEATLCV